MAYLLGEASIRVTPFADHLHTELKKIVEKEERNTKIELPVEVDKAQFEREMKEIRKEIEKFEKNPANLKIDVDLSEKTLLAAEKKIDYVARDRRVNLWIDTHTDHADANIRDIVDKWDGHSIEMEIEVKAPSKMPKMPKLPPITQQTTASPARSVDADWNVINMWSKAWKLANQQVDEGILKIYDRYRQLTVEMVKQAARPAIAFKKAWDQADTFTGFLSTVKTDLDGVKSQYTSFVGTIQRLNQGLAERGGVAGLTKRSVADAKYIFQGFAEAARESFDDIKAAFDKLRAILSGFKAPPIMEWLKKITPEPIIRAARGIRDSVNTIKTNVSNAMNAVATSIKNGVSTAGKHLAALPGQAAKAMKTLGNNIRAELIIATIPLYHFSKNLLGALNMMGLAKGIDFSFIGQKVKQAFGFIKGEAEGLTVFFRKAFTDIKDTSARIFKGIPDAVGGAFNALKTKVSAVSQKIFEPIKNIGSKIGASVSKAFSSMGRHLSAAGSGIKNLATRIGGNFSRAFGRIGGTIFGSLGRKMGAFFNGPGFKMAKRAFGFLGRYASGFGRVAIGAFTKVAGVMMSALMPAIGSVLAGLGAMASQALIGGILALAGAFASVANAAILMAPAMLAAAGISFAALKIGLEGVKTGVQSAFNAGTVEEFQEAIKNLPPAVQEIAWAFREFKPAMDEMKSAVQSNMLSGLAPGIKSAMNNLFPIFSEGMQRLATSWNGAFSQALDTLSSPQANKGLSAIMDGVVAMGDAMKPVLSNLITGFGSLAEQGAKFLGPLGEGIANITDGFAKWAEGLKQIDSSTGLSKFDTFIQNAKTNLGYLKDILGGLFGTIGNVLSAASEAGGGMLAAMASGLQAIQDATAKGSEGYQKIMEFMQGAQAAAEALAPIWGPLFSSIASVGTVLTSVATAAMPGVIAVVQALSVALNDLKGFGPAFGESMGVVLGSFAPLIEMLGVVLGPMLVGLAQGLALAFEPLGGLIERMGPSLERIGVLVGESFNIVGAAIGQLVVALEPFVNSLLTTFEAAMPVLNQVFFWIGEIARVVVENLTPVFTAHDQVLQRIMGSLGGLVSTIGQGLIGILNAVKPAFEAVGDAIGRIFTHLEPLIPILQGVLQSAFSAIGNILSSVVVPIFNFLVDIFMTIVDIALPPLITAIGWLGDAFNIVMPLISGIADILGTILRPVLDVVAGAFRIFGDVVQFVWNVVIKPAIDLLMAAFKGMGQVIEVIIKNIIVPVLQAWQQQFNSVCDWIRNAIATVVEPAMNKLKPLFETVVNAIKLTWSNLKKAFEDPISFFIDVVINKGVVKGWNKMMDFLKIDKKMQEIPNEIKGYKTGGVLSGYTPGRDVHKYYSPTGPALQFSGGEAVMRPEWTKAVGGPAAVEAMNRTARTGGVSAVRKQLGEGAQFYNGGVIPFQRFAEGGIVKRAPKEQEKNPADEKLDARIKGLFNELRSEHGKPYQYGGTGNPSWDCSGLWSGITQYLNGGNLRGGRIFNTESNFRSFGYEPGLTGRVTIGVMNGGGGPNSHMSGTIDGTNIESAGSYGVQIGGQARGSNNSIYNAQYTLAKYLGKYLPGAGGGGFSIIDPVKMAMDWVTSNIVEAIMNPIKEQMSGFTDKYGAYAELPLGLFKHASEALIEAAKEKIIEMNPFGSSSPNSNWSGGGVEHWRPLVEKILESKGLSKDLAGSLLRRMHQESGGDPRAINNWDSNAQKGTPSKGLMQVIDPTFQANKDPGYDDIWDPESNIRASINYALRQYGSLPAAYDRAGGYDQGGEALGKGLLAKYTLRPERVLSPNQTRAFNDFVYGFMPELIRSWQRNPVSIQEGFNQVVKGIHGIQARQDEYREAYIDTTANTVKGWFRARERGEVIGNPLQPYSGRPETFGQELSDNFNRFNQNMAGLSANWLHVTSDPEAYLAAEQEAIERMEKEDEEALEAQRKKEDEERQKQQEESNTDSSDEKQKEIDALNEKKEEELKEAVGDEAKKAIEEQYKKEQEKIDERYKKEDEAKKKQQEEENKRIEEQRAAEDERIKQLKESGVYYYGYEVMKNDGSDPSPYERSKEEEEAWGVGGDIASSVGLGGVFSKINHYAKAAGELNSQIQTVAPSWVAAMNGDYAGLNHNVAVAQAKARQDNEADAKELLPKLVSGGFEMALSAGIVGSRAPFIENVNVGSTPAELMKTLSHYESMQARRGTGTARMR